MQVRRLGMVGAMAMLLVGATAPVAQAAVTTTRYVDDSGPGAPDCGSPAAVEATIQGAIDLSDAADHVIVCPGVYREQLTIDDAQNGLQVTSYRKWDARIRTPAVLLSGPNLVDIDGVDRVRFQGFVLKIDTAAPCNHLEAAISVYDSFGTVVNGNRIVAMGEETIDPVCGYDIGVSVGDIEAMYFLFYELFGGGCCAPSGIGEETDATVRHNYVRDFQMAGITAGPETTTVVKRNGVHYIHEGQTNFECLCPISRVSVGRYSLPTLDTLLGFASVGTAGEVPIIPAAGIVVSGGSKVSGNHVGSGPDFFGDGIFEEAPGEGAVLFAGIWRVPFAEDTPPAQITRNYVAQNLIDIFDLVGDGDLIADNRVDTSVGGIVVAALTDSTIRDNTQSVGIAGISVADGLFSSAFGLPFPSEGNTFEDNTTDRNALVNCFDDSLGSESFGTANTWTGNTYTNLMDETSNPVGICTAAP